MILDKAKRCFTPNVTFIRPICKTKQRIIERNNLLLKFIVIAFSAASLLIVSSPLYSAERSGHQNANNQGYLFNGYKLNDKEQAVLNTLILEDLYMFVEGKSTQRGSQTAYKEHWEEITESLVYVTADQMQTEYENNEAAVDKKYLGKNFFLSGQVAAINRGEENNYFITFIGNNYVIKTKAYFDREYEDYLANLKKGGKVGIICQGDKMVNGCAIAINCMPLFNWIEKYENGIISVSDKPPYRDDRMQGAAFAIVMASALPGFGSCSKMDMFNFRDCLSSFLVKIGEVDARAREQAISAASRKLKIDSSKIKKGFPFWYKKAESVEKSSSKKAAEKRNKTTNAGGVIY